MFRLEAGGGRGVNYALTCAGRLGEGWQCSFRHRATGGDGCIGVSNSGRSGAGSPPLTSFLPWSPEIPAACLSLSSFSLSAELPFCPSGSPRSRSVSFFVPLSLSSLGSFLFKGPRWGVRTFRRSQSHFFTLHPFDSAVWSQAPPLPEVRGERTVPDSLPCSLPCAAAKPGPSRRALLGSSCPAGERSFGLSRPRAAPLQWEKCSRACRCPRRPTGISLLRLVTLGPFRVGVNFRH